MIKKQSHETAAPLIACFSPAEPEICNATQEKRRNAEIRLAAQKKKLRLWELADLLNISEATLQRKLRHELSDSEKERWLKLIEEADRK